jgi:hypothetical protein
MGATAAYTPWVLNVLGSFNRFSAPELVLRIFRNGNRV